MPCSFDRAEGSLVAQRGAQRRQMARAAATYNITGPWKLSTSSSRVHALLTETGQKALLEALKAAGLSCAALTDS